MNAQQKIAGIVLFVILVIIIIVILWQKKVLQFSTPASHTAPAPTFNVPVERVSVQTPAPAPPAEEDSVIPLPADEGAGYAVLNLAAEEQPTQYSASGAALPPSPSLSLYNVKTQSYITGLGDPIRGDLTIEPRRDNMYKSPFTNRDNRIGALTSIA